MRQTKARLFRNDLNGADKLVSLFETKTFYNTFVLGRCFEFLVQHFVLRCSPPGKGYPDGVALLDISYE